MFSAINQIQAAPVVFIKAENNIGFFSSIIGSAPLKNSLFLAFDLMCSAFYKYTFIIAEENFKRLLPAASFVLESVKG